MTRFRQADARRASLFSPVFWFALAPVVVTCSYAQSESFSPPDVSEELPRFVGPNICIECHSNGASASPCAMDPIAGHRDAYAALSKPEARHIAALCGVGDAPRKARLCLGCHSTGADEGPRWHMSGFRPEDGVQCEACHGPGSVHIERRRLGHSLSSEPTWMDRAVDVRRGDRMDCDTCHRPRDSHREVLEHGFRLSPNDGHYKTPVNLAVMPDGRLLVACAQSNSMIVVDPMEGAIGEIPAGRRPQDVAVDPQGRLAFVSNRLEETVSVLDLASLNIVGGIVVGAEPHGLVIDPAGDTLYVLNTGQDAVSVVDIGTSEETKWLAAGMGPWSAAVSGNGRHAVVTSVRPDYVPFRDPPRSELTVLDLESRRVARRLAVPGANMLQGIASIPGRDAFLFALVRTKNLVPITQLQQDWVISSGLGVLRADGRIDQVLLDEPASAFPDPTDVAVSPDGRFALVTSAGADEVAVIDVDALLALIDGLTDEQRRDVLPNHLGYCERFVLKRINVGASPRGVSFSRDGQTAYVANALDDSISVIETTNWEVSSTIPLGGPQEISIIRRGERLFHTAAITFGRQFSCASCHPDGHLNGLSFDIEADGIGMHPMDNRTLRGIFDTGPFKWEGTNPSLQRQCGARLSVFFTRLAPFAPDELNALVWYESTIELPPNPYRRPEGLSTSQYRGRLVFHRTHDNGGNEIPPQRRCATCHDSPHFTNRKITPLRNAMWFDYPVKLDRFDLFNYDEFGDHGTLYYLESGTPLLEFDVPHLTNICQGAPYLHNGAARTLEEIWTRFNPTEDHGRAIDLTREQFNDLIAYLKSL
ncbi:MAG: beta-propeller fold lactonase family protein [Phycisphaerae bacterium]|nr:beta-propeller fold lactonase family protein [Phycisphaerae bacterium]